MYGLKGVIEPGVLWSSMPLKCGRMQLVVKTGQDSCHSSHKPSAVQCAIAIEIRSPEITASCVDMQFAVLE